MGNMLHMDVQQNKAWQAALYLLSLCLGNINAGCQILCFASLVMTVLSFLLSFCAATQWVHAGLCNPESDQHKLSRLVKTCS